MRRLVLALALVFGLSGMALAQDVDWDSILAEHKAACEAAAAAGVPPLPSQSDPVADYINWMNMHNGQRIANELSWYDFWRTWRRFGK